MKTKLLLSALLSFYFCLLSSQVPLGFNYQAIARDGSGTILANLALPVKIDIQTSTGTVIYEELFSTVTSNQFGLISLVVGTGVWQSGSAPSFSAIDWKAQPLYLKTIIQYPGITWTTMGTSQIWGVPYSLVAKDVEGPIAKLGITGTTTDMEEALFEVKNKTGQTVFAVYNEGIRAYVGNGDAKGKKGGFSVGGYDATKSDTIRNIFVLSTDSARLYFDSKPQGQGKGVRGGFSVGGYDMKKGSTLQNYLNVTPATTQIFTEDTVKGFSVGNISTGLAQDYLKLTPENYFIGHESGQNLKTGKFNSTIGYQSGKSITDGESNAFMGYQSGYLNRTGGGNLFLGYQTGYSTIEGNYNSFVGYRSGYSNVVGLNNSFFGSFTGYSNTRGNYNTFAGDSTGYSNLIGDENSFFGNKAGFQNFAGDENSFFGNKAGFQNSNGSDNIFIGNLAGYSSNTDSSVFIGNKSGYNNTSGRSNVFIGNRSGYSCTVGYGNVFMGYYSGFSNTNGNSNLLIGFNAGLYNTSGTNNVILGYKAGSGISSQIIQSNTIIGSSAGTYITVGQYNVLIGDRSGYLIQGGSQNVFLGSGTGSVCTGYQNVFIGFRAGCYETGSNMLIIDNQSRTNQADQRSKAMFYGQFNLSPALQYLQINANVGIKVTPTHLIQLLGGAYSDGSTWTNSSDRNLKENFEPVDGAMIIYLIDQLPINKWNYKTDNATIKHIGPVAQDFYSLFSLGNNDTSISTVDPSGVALVAIKELSKQNKSMKEQIESQKKEIEDLKTLVNKLIASQTAQVNK